MISEIASSEPPQYNTKVIKQFAIMTVVWGIVGMLVGVIIAAQLVWPELNVGPYLHFGRLRPLHTNAVILAFGGIALAISLLDELEQLRQENRELHRRLQRFMDGE